MRWFTKNFCGAYASCRSAHRWPLLFLETIGPIEPPIWGKIGPQNQFFWLSFNRYGTFLWKKLINCTRYSIPHRKGSTHFCRLTPTWPQKWSHHLKIIFRRYFRMVFFFEKIVQWKIFKTSFPTKKVILIFVVRRPFSSKWPCPLIDGFSHVFRKCCVFKTATQHSLSLCLVIPRLVSHFMSPHTAVSQRSPSLTIPAADFIGWAATSSSAGPGVPHDLNVYPRCARWRFTARHYGNRSRLIPAYRFLQFWRMTRILHGRL